MKYLVLFLSILTLAACGNDTQADHPATGTGQSGLAGIWQDTNRLLVLEGDGDLYLPNDPQRQGLSWQQQNDQLMLRYLDGQAHTVKETRLTLAHDDTSLTLTGDDHALAGRYQPSPGALTSLSGTVKVNDNSALPANAVLVVTLTDASGGPSPIISKRLKPLTLDHGQMRFRLYYAPKTIQPDHQYRLNSQILADGGLLFQTLTPRRVEPGHPEKDISLTLLPLIGQPQTLRGHLIGVEDSAIFTPCGSDNRLMLAGPAAGALRDFYRQQRSKPLQPVVVRITGTIGTQPGSQPGSRQATIEARDFQPGHQPASCTQVNASLTNSYWQLAYLGQTPINGDRRPAHLVLQDDGKLHGNTGCNNLNGHFQHQDDQLTFSGLATTRMACNGSGNHEAAFLQALRETVRAEIDGQLLTLFNKQGKPVASLLATYLY
ncbi:MAG: META domain-containing protein [Alcanivorax sp.]|nr:META domain-containing protein [Alcanivorax sp.]